MVVSLLQQSARDRVLTEGLFSLKLNPGSGLCHVTGCRKRHADEKKKVGDVRFCHRHWQQRWRARNPKQAAFATLRMHARKRRIGFTLDFAFFVTLTDQAGYWDQDAGSHGDKLSVDRIEAHLGYSDTNVQVLTVTENTAKGNVERHLSPFVQALLKRRRGESEAWTVTGPREDSWLD